MKNKIRCGIQNWDKRTAEKDRMDSERKGTLTQSGQYGVFSWNKGGETKFMSRAAEAGECLEYDISQKLQLYGFKAKGLRFSTHRPNKITIFKL